MTFIFFIFAILIFLLFNNFKNLKRDFDFLKSEFDKHNEEVLELKKEIAELKITSIRRIDSNAFIKVNNDTNVNDTQLKQNISNSISTLENDLKGENKVHDAPKNEIFNSEKPILTFESKAETRLEKSIPIEEKVYEKSAFSKFIKKAENQFADNWTGILGTAIMVLGIGYLSVYTALKVSPLLRVLILWLYAGLLIGTFYILKKKEEWDTTGLWLRSAGASLFLFGCYGASQIEALVFILNPITGYLLIGLGISLNLYIGYIIKKQTFLSLHVLLSMLILIVIPEKSLATILLAAITATIGIILSYKEKWEYHSLIVIIIFIVFDVWFNAQGTKLTAIENSIAIIGIIAVAISCILMQYRKVYENTFFDKAAFITHLTNWVLFATGLLLHATGSKFKIFVLFIGAIVCLTIALRARKKKIYWLYHLDGMVSFTLLVLSIIMLNDWKVGIDIVFCVLYLAILVCLFIVYKVRETLLHKIFLGINHFFGIGLVIFSALMVSNSIDLTKITNSFLISIVLFIIAISVPIITSIRKEFSELDSFFVQKSWSWNGILAILFSVFIILNANNVLFNNSFVYVLIVIALIWALLKKKFENPTFDIGRIIFYILALVVAIFIIKIQEKTFYDWTFTLGLFLVVVLNWTMKYFYKNDFLIRFIGIAGINALLLVLVYKYLPQYEIIQVFSLFAIALLNHEFFCFSFKRDNLTNESQRLLFIFYYFFAIIGSLLFLYRMSNFTNTEIGFTCLGISGIEIYVLFAKRIRKNIEETTAEGTNFSLLNSEFLVFNALLFGFSCLQFEYVSVYLGILAILSFIGFQKFDELKRFKNFSFHFVKLAMAVSVYYSYNKLNNFTILNWVTQLSSIGLGFVLVILLNKKEENESLKTNYQILLNTWLSLIMFLQLAHEWLPVFWATIGILNLYLYHKNISKQKNISIVYYLLANLHLGFLSFNYYESKFLMVYLLIFALLAGYIFLAYKWLEEYKLKNSLLIYPITLSIGSFLYLTFDKGILTFFWILEALGLLILGILNKEKYFRYVSLSLVGVCVVRLMFFDLSNADMLIRAMVLLGVGVILLIMNSLFKKFKDRFE